MFEAHTGDMKGVGGRGVLAAGLTLGVVASLVVLDGAIAQGDLRLGDTGIGAATLIGAVSSVPSGSTAPTSLGVPEPALVAWPATSLAATATVPAPLQTGVMYGSLAEQTLDVYGTSLVAPPDHEPRGAVVYLHGGAWASGTSDLAESPEPQLVKSIALDPGWMVFSVNYRLAGEAAFPGALLDVNTAVRWVKANAATYGIDADAVVVYGYSAGGHLAALLGTTWNDPMLQPGALSAELAARSPRPAAVVALSAPLDVAAWGDSNPDPANPFSPSAYIAAFAGCEGDGHHSCTADQLAVLDVTRDADAGDPPVYLGHGDLDGIVTVDSQLGAAMRLAAAIGVQRVHYDVTADGPAEHRNHIPDEGLDAAALSQFLDEARSA